MRVTFVHPAAPDAIPGQSKLTILVNRMVPIGVLQLAAVLDKAGHETFVYDCLGPKAHPHLAQNTQRVLATRPELVAFSATTCSFLGAYEMALRIKETCPHVRTLVGGVHASSAGSTLLRHFPAIDFLCCGEGEGLMLDLAEGKPLAGIGNLVYRQGDRIITNPRRKRITQLDDLPFPAYEKLPGFPEKYHLPLFSFIKRHGATMITSRGCPYTCSYCDRSVFERNHACNSPRYVQEHMRWLRDRFGVHHINFYDDLFTLHRNRVLELCDTLARDPLGIDFNCAVRVGHADKEMLKALKRAGCIQVSVGIESAAPELLQRHKAGVTLDQVREAVDAAHSVGLRAKGLFIFGLPGETPETARQTSDFIQLLGLDELNVSKFSPFPGAPLWPECISGREGRFREDWRLMDCLHFTYVPKAFESQHHMDYIYNQCLDRFYRGKEYQRLLLRRFWQHRWSIWHVLRHLPGFARAAFAFKPRASQKRRITNWPALHPDQPLLSQFSPQGEARPAREIENAFQVDKTPKSQTTVNSKVA